ncbi:MAG: hypothetical protein FWF34_02225 [Alphaproteobacteria bacterium]|nr:hypothetical protein [Alphaproteobacteria bacterium]MCL2890049.1 hypothetical protein [Alphaproteobacteria bacterium]
MKISKILGLGVIALVAPHLFCCGVPILMAVMSLVAPGAHIWHFHLIPDRWMPAVFVASVIMLAIGYYFAFRSHKECKDHNHNHKAQKIIIYIATALFIVSIVLHFFIGHTH